MLLRPSLRHGLPSLLAEDQDRARLSRVGHEPLGAEALDALEHRRICSADGNRQNLACGEFLLGADDDDVRRRQQKGDQDLRSEVNSELNFPPNFEGLVLGCIDADFCK